MTSSRLKLVHLGKVAYDAALATQTSTHRALVEAARARSRAAAAAATSIPTATAVSQNSAAAEKTQQLRPPMGTVFVCEHTPGTFTCGRRDTTDGIKGGRDADMPLVHIRRGGGLTYHGPGQLTLYPVVDVQQLFRAAPTRFGTSPLRWYTWALEQCIIRTAARCGVAGCTASCTGVWAPQVPSQPPQPPQHRTSLEAECSGGVVVGSSQPPLDASVSEVAAANCLTNSGSSSSSSSCATTGAGGEAAACGRREESNQLSRTNLKVGFVGLQAEAWVSMHGFSINVTPEAVAPFKRIVVCELPDARATSLQEMRDALRAAGVESAMANDIPMTVDEVARIAVEELGIITGCSYAEN